MSLKQEILTIVIEAAKEASRASSCCMCHNDINKAYIAAGSFIQAIEKALKNE